mgnify:CR=1 FL=1
MDQSKIGKFIAALRKEKGMTQEQQRNGCANILQRLFCASWRG